MHKSFISYQHLLAIFLAFIISSSASANEPSSEILKGFMEFSLPAGWNVVTVDINGSTNFGTESNPFYKQKFTAKVSPSKPLYIHEKWIGGTEVIELYASSEKPLLINGIASSELKNDRWSSQFEFAGKPFESGKSIESYSSTAVLSGSDEETAVAAKAQEAKIAQDRAKADAEARKRAAKVAADNEAKAKQIRFQNLVTKYGAFQGVEKLTGSNTGKPEDPRFPLAMGDEYYIVVEGKKVRSCQGGNNQYSTKSYLYTAAVNSGIIKSNEKAILKVKVIPINHHLGRHEANGVVCGKWKKPFGIKFYRIHDSDYREI